MNKQTLAMAALTTVITGLATSQSAVAGPTVCVPANARAIFDVSFSAAWENGVTIVRVDTGRVVRRFNNYFRRGAGGEWNQGAGRYITGFFPRRTCLNIIGQHKRSGPNGSVPWRTSRARVFRSNPPQIGFEDAGDNDFNDAFVRIRFVRRQVQSGFRGNVFCAPGNRQLTFFARFSAYYENGLRIIDLRSGRVLRTFNNYFRRGAGGEWNQGAGPWSYYTSRGPQCFRVVGIHKNGPPNGSIPWLRSRFRSGGSRIGFEDATDNDFNDASITVRY